MYKPRYLQHTLNTSPSKEAHSFGKAERFIYNRDSPRYLHFNIDIKLILNNLKQSHSLKHPKQYSERQAHLLRHITFHLSLIIVSRDTHSEKQ